MALKFFLTADWQIGRPFKWFPDEMAGRLQAARLDTIDRIGALAKTQDARFVLVAGDVFDAEGLPRKVRLQPLKRMEAHRDVRWILLIRRNLLRLILMLRSCLPPYGSVYLRMTRQHG